MSIEQAALYSVAPLQGDFLSQNQSEKLIIQQCVSILSRITPQIFNADLLDCFEKIIFNPTSTNRNPSALTQGSSPPEPHPIRSPSQAESIYKVTLVVSSFCSRGYGLAAFKSWLSAEGKSIAMSKSEYDSIIEEAISRTYCRLIEYLLQEKEEHGQSIPACVNPDEIAQIYKIAIECRTSLRPSSCRAFFNSLKALNFIQSYEGVALEEALEMYRQFRLGIARAQREGRKCEPLQQRLLHPPPELGLDLSLRWSVELERELLAQYRKGLSFIAIGKRMRELFPAQAHLINSDILKGKFTRILRAALRKLQGKADGLRDQGGPVLARLQESKQRLILNSEGAGKVRSLLLNLHERDLDSGEIKQMVLAVNNFLAGEEQGQVQKLAQPFYHPRFKNGRREYGKYNRPYEPNQEKRKFRKEEEYVQRGEKEKMERSSQHDPHSDNESVLSIA